MKIITIANDKWELAMHKSNRGGEIFMNPTQGRAKKTLINYITTCRAINAEETFIILCNDFDAATVRTLGDILEKLGLAEQSLILFGINHFEAGIIHRLQNQKTLGFFRTLYSKSYWNVIGKFSVKN